MTTQIFKTALAGILAGLAFFMLPFFLLKAFIFCMIIGAIFRLMGGRRRHHHFGGMHPAFAHRYQDMSDEEKANFKANYANRCGCYYEQTTNSNNQTQTT